MSEEKKLLLKLLDKVTNLENKVTAFLPLVPEWVPLVDIANTLKTNKLKSSNIDRKSVV